MVDVQKWTLPITVGYNTASTGDWAKRSLSLFVGGGASLSWVRQKQTPLGGFTFSDNNIGWGVHAQASLDVPLGDVLYASAIARYEFATLFSSSRLAADLDSLGGTFLGVEAGVRF